MERFYENIRNGQSLAVALRKAKLQYMEGTLAVEGGQHVSLSHPFFWAPFVLTTTSLDHQGTSKEKLAAKTPRPPA
jgi:CHAT domain-containing protein